MHLSKSSRVISKSTIAIVGGTGRMGRVLVKMLYPSGARIVVCSRNPEKAESVSHLPHMKMRRINDVQDADVVVVSVPIDKTVTTCRKLLKRMKPDSLLVDVTSVKKGIVNTIMKHVPENIEYMSIHPLFGPDTEDFKGENVLAIIPKNGPLSRSMLRFLSKSGLRTTYVTVDEHDRKTAVTQALHHFAYVSMVACMSKLMSWKDFHRFSTKSLRKTIGLIQSLSDNINTVIDIQRRNPYSASVRKSFAGTVSALSRMEDKKNRRIIDSMKVLRRLSCSYI